MLSLERYVRERTQMPRAGPTLFVLSGASHVIGFSNIQSHEHHSTSALNHWTMTMELIAKMLGVRRSWCEC